MSSSEGSKPQTSHFLRHLRYAKFTRSYFVLSCLYGLSTLIVPFATQMLVNNLSLGGFWTNTYAFLLIVGAGVTFSLFIKYLQTVLLEFVQRNLFFREISRWQRRAGPGQINSPYLIEVFAILKSFSAIVSEGVDLILRSLFGALALAFIHPAFLVVCALFIGSIAIIRWQGRDAIATAKSESHRKYEFFDRLVPAAHSQNGHLVYDFLQARDEHFKIVRRQAVTTYASILLLQMTLLSWGIYLIQINQLSIGQLVSAEIIISGITISYINLPKLLRNVYDFETSCSKLELEPSRTYEKAA